MARRRQRALAALAVFACTLLALPIVVGRVLGEPRAEALEAKWRDFENGADEYDVVFIGTSHVQRHVDPRRVDEVLTARGIIARSYNFGLPKMSILEGLELVERLERRRPRRLKFVVIEPTLYLYDTDNWASDRAIAGHDWRNTALAIRLTWSSEARRQAGFWGKVASIRPHVLSFLCRYFNLGRGWLVFSQAKESPEREGSADVPVSDSRGFAALPNVPPPAGGELGEWQRRFLRFLEIEPDWKGRGLSVAEIAYFDWLLERIRQTGAQPVFLLGPKVKRDSHTAAVLSTHGERYGKVPLLNHLRGHGEDDLYQLCYWHDFDHLNADGATLFSCRLGADISRLFRGIVSR
ncbi:MAG TPA: hypothetical protein VG826_21155 [Pirellulales bacterium]|nr:hypothetical protein [Pirellulales bacterium]